MGADDDNINASIAHVVLACVSGTSLGRGSGKSFTHPGMHTNLLIHGVLGFLHYQSGRFNNDFGPPYALSYKASRYLPLPCLMADLYRGNEVLCAVHLLSGLVPFCLALGGNDNPHLGHTMIAANVISLGYYALQHRREWAWYTAGAACLAYFCAPQMGSVAPKVFYPLSLALMEYCACRLYRIHYDGASAPGPPAR